MTLPLWLEAESMSDSTRHGNRANVSEMIYEFHRGDYDARMGAA